MSASRLLLSAKSRVLRSGRADQSHHLHILQTFTNEFLGDSWGFGGRLRPLNLRDPCHVSAVRHRIMVCLRPCPGPIPCMQERQQRLLVLLAFQRAQPALEGLVPGAIVVTR